MFRIKICGVTSALDAAMAVDAGADAVGINFFPGSRRYVAPERAGAIVEAVRGKAAPVAVFVNESPALIAEICAGLGIGVVQLSGYEPPGDAARIPLRRIKAVHLSDPGGLEGFRGYPCDALLLDAAVAGLFGGTGTSLDWEGLGRACGGPRIRFAGDPPGAAARPWMLAGGLTPENVGTATRLARPYGVDVASGVEGAPGRKDPDRVRRFVENARRGLGIGVSRR
jgi:phosphoribosylanthranilate isomerase